MDRLLPLIVMALLACFPMQPALANPASLEELINERLAGYPLTPDNKHRLAAYSELKGDFSPGANTISLNFGDLGKMEIYPEHVLLKIGTSRVFSMDRRRLHPQDVAMMNESLRLLFEQISLLANHDAHPDLIYFVDEHLAKKNLEPFEKLYLRHILIRFGKYDPQRHMVEFRTEWLPVKTYEFEVPGNEGTHLVKKPIDPLRIQLDEATVRGFYLMSGGTVYVEDVERDVFYASGEYYTPNVSAFKIFLQQLFTQTTTYVVAEERTRIDRIQANRHEAAFSPVVAQVTPASIAARPEGYQQRAARAGESLSQSPVKPLYSPTAWMTQMLGLLREQNALFDRDVAKFLIHQPFYPELFEHLTAEEKAFFERIRR